jgi:putative RNA 2'-phosphotransferase
VDGTRLSKFLSLVLRHEPGKIGLSLDEAGWVEIDALLAPCERHGVALTRERLGQIVAGSDKQRFAFDATGRRIRASQGHSVPVDLGYDPVTPPTELFHGTVAKFVAAIRAEGLRKGARHHVHLSDDEATAGKVGQRRGAPVVLVVDAAAMHCAGYVFFRSANGVWLTDAVPSQFITFPKGHQ